MPMMLTMLQKILKVLNERAYTYYVNLKPGTDWEHLVSLFNTKFFHTEANFTVVELGGT